MKKLSEPVDFTKFCCAEAQAEAKTLVRAMGFDPEQEKPRGVYVRPGFIIKTGLGSIRTVAPDGLHDYQCPGELSVWCADDGRLTHFTPEQYTYNGETVLGYEKE